MVLLDSYSLPSLASRAYWFSTFKLFCPQKFSLFLFYFYFLWLIYLSQCSGNFFSELMNDCICRTTWTTGNINILGSMDPLLLWIAGTWSGTFSFGRDITCFSSLKCFPFIFFSCLDKIADEQYKHDIEIYIMYLLQERHFCVLAKYKSRWTWHQLDSCWHCHILRKWLESNFGFTGNG